MILELERSERSHNVSQHPHFRNQEINEGTVSVMTSLPNIRAKPGANASKTPAKAILPDIYFFLNR